MRIALIIYLISNTDTFRWLILLFDSVCLNITLKLEEKHISYFINTYPLERVSLTFFGYKTQGFKVYSASSALFIPLAISRPLTNII